MVNEIGSEFWDSSSLKRDKIFLLSGRTALDFIIRDILKNHSVKTALLPSYCCHTMIEPFLRHNIPVRFYDIFFADGRLRAQVPEIEAGTIFYCMTYFGFTDNPRIDINKIRESAEVIIEDQTHSWLTGKSFEGADYRYASYRKWSGFDGIAAAEKCNGFFGELPRSINEKYCSMRRRAAEMKKDYIEHGIGNKQDYLKLFAEAEEYLERDYVEYAPMADTIAAFCCSDWENVKRIRRNNAQTLIDGLKNTNGLQILFHDMKAEDAPLFVPIAIPNRRKKLRQYLIDNSVFCPIHWPISEMHKGISHRAEELYDQELSLICDQRYDETDMQRIVEIIKGDIC